MPIGATISKMVYRPKMRQTAHMMINGVMRCHPIFGMGVNMKYCIALINDGTDHAVFMAGPDDERLTWDQVTSMTCLKEVTWFNFKDTTYDNYLKNGGS